MNISEVLKGISHSVNQAEESINDDYELTLSNDLDAMNKTELLQLDECCIDMSELFRIKEKVMSDYIVNLAGYYTVATDCVKSAYNQSIGLNIDYAGNEDTKAIYTDSKFGQLTLYTTAVTSRLLSIEIHNIQSAIARTETVGSPLTASLEEAKLYLEKATDLATNFSIICNDFTAAVTEYYNTYRGVN